MKRATPRSQTRPAGPTDTRARGDRFPVLARGLPGVREIVHVDGGGAASAEAQADILRLSALLAPLGTRSHLIHDTRGPITSDSLSSQTACPGLGDRPAADDTVAEQIRARVANLSPDLVFLHNVFDARIVRALAAQPRDYRLLWQIHDHFPTCLTAMRALRDSAAPVCRRRLSMSCLLDAERGHCVSAQAGRTYQMGELFLRLKLLESVRCVDSIIVSNAFLKNMLVGNLPEIEPRIHLVTPPVGGRPTAPGRGNGATPVIAFHGRLAYEQGLHVAIAALSLLPSQETLAFTIAGQVADAGYWAHCQKRIAQLETTHHRIQVQYVGTLDDPQRDTLYATADLVLIPSLWSEPMNTVAAEALVRGAAVIASNVGEIGEWIKDGRTGLLVEPRDADAMARAILRLLRDDALRAELVLAGRWLIGNQFSAHEYLETLAAAVDTGQVGERGSDRTDGQAESNAHNLAAATTSGVGRRSLLTQGRPMGVPVGSQKQR
ncbi:MAG: hypothetical protein B7Z66_05665 [Chromatiales bacterium 21-64-14]|nr:MAG: hypothetical protein B7Z66_05665 [Chromatiales bacterium 21-64-14]HQU15211.1 glycosyltransferase family 4 protein [Gammaproteobacteria bacterium]